MPQNASEWYDDTRRRIDAEGHRDADWPSWSSWPLDESGRPRPLLPPGDEPPRGGGGGADCFMCAADARVDASYLLWRDEVAMIGLPLEPVALPFKAFLMPRRHADLADLTPDEAARMGQLLSATERAATDVLDVPRLQVMRWGEGQEHLHWWLLGRPTGMRQLGGTFVAMWDDLLPPRPAEEVRADLTAVCARLVEIAGGELLTS